MKVKYFTSLLFLIPALSWAQGTRLAICRTVGGIPIDMITPGVGKTQIASAQITAGTPVTLAIGIFDDGWNPVFDEHSCALNIVNSEAIPFLNTFPKSIFLNDPISGACTVTVIPCRATLYQDENLAPDISQYKFVVTDNTTSSVLPDTSFPLDSVMPGPYAKLLLVLPGESHYPGCYSDFLTGNLGVRGVPRNISAGFFYDFTIYGTDNFWNTVPATPDTIFIERCLGSLAPQTPLPTNFYPLYDIAKGLEIAKRTLSVLYAATGRAWLRAKSTYTGVESMCREFSVEGPAPNPEDMIIVLPNPIGKATGDDDPCADISIMKVALGKGKIRAKIFNQFGALVREFKDKDIGDTNPGEPSKGFWTIRWCCDNDKGHRVANGVYHLCVEVTQVEKAGVWREKIGVAW